MRKTNVLVTAANGLGYLIIKALKTSIEKSYNIISTDITPYSSGLYISDKRYIVPKASDQDYINIIFSICEQENIDVVIPCSEIEIEELVLWSTEFTEKDIILLTNPPSVVNTCLDKLKLNIFLSNNGFPHPRTIPADDEITGKNIDEIGGLPAIVKSCRGTGSKYLKIVKTFDELVGYIKMLKKMKISAIIQEYIGDRDSEYTIGALFSKEGDFIDAITIRRILEGVSLQMEEHIDNKRYSISTGWSQGYIERNERINDYVKEVGLKLGAKGPLNFQCRIAGDEIQIFEINPRFSGTALIRAMAGFNEADILIRNFVFNEKLSTVPYRENLLALRNSSFHLVDRKDFDQMNNFTRSI
jgi:carbamoyl-phosphate synthase large subunit